MPSPGHLNEMKTLWVVSAPHFKAEGVETLSGLHKISPEVARPGLKLSHWDARFHCLPLSQVAHEFETLGELLAYLLYTFLMNRPIGLIKGKKDELFLPTVADYLHCICVDG